MKTAAALVLGAYCTTTDAFTTSSTNRLTTALLSSNYDDDPRGPPRPMPNGPPPPLPTPRANYADPPSIDLDGQLQDRQSNLWHRRTPDYQSINEDPRQFDMQRRYVSSCTVSFVLYLLFCVLIPLLPYSFSQRPPDGTGDPSMRPRQSWWESHPGDSSRVQGGSRVSTSTGTVSCYIGHLLHKLT